jgi:hypothetical protein
MEPIQFMTLIALFIFIFFWHGVRVNVEDYIGWKKAAASGKRSWVLIASIHRNPIIYGLFWLAGDVCMLASGFLFWNTDHYDGQTGRSNIVWIMFFVGVICKNGFVSLHDRAVRYDSAASANTFNLGTWILSIILWLGFWATIFVYMLYLFLDVRNVPAGLALPWLVLGLPDIVVMFFSRNIRADAAHFYKNHIKRSASVETL